MVIAENKSVFIDYELKDEQGVVMDTSNGREPLNYIHGHGSLIVGLERALEGKAIGNVFNVKISSEDAYGQRNQDSGIRRVKCIQVGILQ